jgi:hypothetical protein
LFYAKTFSIQLCIAEDNTQHREKEMVMKKVCILPFVMGLALTHVAFAGEAWQPIPEGPYSVDVNENKPIDLYARLDVGLLLPFDSDVSYNNGAG